MLFRIQTGAGANGRTVDFPVDANSMQMMREARTSTVAGAFAARFGAIDASLPSVAAQMAAQMGVNPQSRMLDLLEGKFYQGPSGAEAATTGVDGSVTGRLVTQAVLFDAVEASLRDDLTGYSAMLLGNAALKRSIDGNRWETPILDFTRPAHGRPQPVAQLSEPTRFLTLKTSMKSNAIMGDAIGIEFSDQVMKDITIDVVSLSLKRMLEESGANMAMYQIMSLLQGDADYGMAPLASVIPGGATQASTLDPAATGGKLTQTAWVKWLWKHNLRRTITTVITDFNGAMAVENRLGRPLAKDNFGSSKRIDTLDNIINPRWPDKVDVIITQDPSWPANTIVGFDKRFGYNHITSNTMDYKATEEFAIRRSTKMRIDSGSMVERFMNDAWDILDFN